MSDIELDLQTVEEDLETEEDDEDRRVVLGVLDGTTPDEEWLAVVDGGDTLVLDVKGELNELAAGFARDVSEAGGDLMHFRGFLVVTPPDVSIDASRVR